MPGTNRRASLWIPIVHYADDCDAKLPMIMTILAEAEGDDAVTTRRNVLGQQVYRGGE